MMVKALDTDILPVTKIKDLNDIENKYEGMIKGVKEDNRSYLFTNGGWEILYGMDSWGNITPTEYTVNSMDYKLDRIIELLEKIVND